VTAVTFDYGTYLASREWALLKRQVRERSGGWCERCRAERVSSIHHLTYERIGHERLEDLIAVGRGCHEYLSAVSEFDPAETVEREGIAAALAGDITWAQLEQALRVVEAAQDFEPEPLSDAEWQRLQPPPPKWHHGANSDEVLAFDIYPSNPGDGSALPEMSLEQLDSLAATAVEFLRVAPTAWVKRYAAAIRAEALRRGVRL
jgi:hypothetical protein